MFRTVTLILAALACLPPPAWSRSPEVPSGDPVTLKIDAHRRMTLDGTPTSEPALLTALSRVTAGDHERVIIIQPNAATRFGQMDALLHRLQEAGYTRVMLSPVDATSGARR